jgi:hypothetical protein
VDENPAQAVPSPITNSRRKAMSCRAIIVGLATAAPSTGGLMEAGSGDINYAGAAFEAINTVARQDIGMNDNAPAGLPAYVTCMNSADTDTDCNFFSASVTIPHDLTVVDAANRRVLISQGLSRRDPARTRFGFTPGTLSSSLLPAAPADGKAEPAGFNNPTIINCAGGSAC